MLSLFEQGKHQEAAEILLEIYYDPLYNHTLKKNKYSFEVENDGVQKAAEEIKQKIFKT